jgi:hypothetical protein
VATLRRLHPAPPAIKASAVVRIRILFTIWYQLSFPSPGEGNGYAATKPARLAANSLKYEDD